MTKFEQMLIDAQVAGYEVIKKEGCTLIVKLNKRTKAIISGIIVYADGVGFLADVRLDCARPIRTVKAQRKALGLGE